MSGNRHSHSTLPDPSARGHWDSATHSIISAEILSSWVHFQRFALRVPPLSLVVCILGFHCFFDLGSTLPWLNGHRIYEADLNAASGVPKHPPWTGNDNDGKPAGGGGEHSASLRETTNPSCGAREELQGSKIIIIRGDIISGFGNSVSEAKKTGRYGVSGLSRSLGGSRGSGGRAPGGGTGSAPHPLPACTGTPAAREGE